MDELPAILDAQILRSPLQIEGVMTHLLTPMEKTAPSRNGNSAHSMPC